MPCFLYELLPPDSPRGPGGFPVAGRAAAAIGLVLLLAGGPAGAGVILNTLQGYQDRQSGWTGGLDGVFSGSGGNTERILLEAGGRVQWLDPTDRLRLQVSGGYEESAGQETARHVVAHLRHNHRLNRPLASILFAQIQHNPFQRLRSRWLLGGGLRYDLRDDERGLAAVGVTPMLEIERLQDQGGHLARGRLSVFLHLARKLSETVRVDGVVFWQPLLSEFAASRTVGNLSLTTAVSGRVDLKLGAALEDNARPPAGVERTDWRTYLGFGVDF